MCDDLSPWSLQAGTTKLCQSLTAAPPSLLEFSSQFMVWEALGIILLDSSAVLLTRNPPELSLMPCPSLTRCLQRLAQRVCGTPSL